MHQPTQNKIQQLIMEEGEWSTNRAPKVQIVAIVQFLCATGAPPHVAAGTWRTHFTSNLEEPCSSVAIILAKNVCARYFRDATRCHVTSQFLNGRATWLSLALDFPPTKENRMIRCVHPESVYGPARRNRPMVVPCLSPNGHGELVQTTIYLACRMISIIVIS